LPKLGWLEKPIKESKMTTTRDATHAPPVKIGADHTPPAVTTQSAASTATAAVDRLEQGKVSGFSFENFIRDLNTSMVEGAKSTATDPDKKFANLDKVMGKYCTENMTLFSLTGQQQGTTYDSLEAILRATVLSTPNVKFTVIGHPKPSEPLSDGSVYVQSLTRIEGTQTDYYDLPPGIDWSKLGAAKNPNTGNATVPGIGQHYAVLQVYTWTLTPTKDAEGKTVLKISNATGTSDLGALLAAYQKKLAAK
jgi:hypothetical protein